MVAGMAQERRRMDRYRLAKAELSILSITTEEASNVDFKPVEPLDFNRFGLSFDSSHPFHVGDVLRIQLLVGEEPVGELIGFICSSQLSANQYRCGVQFDFNPEVFSIGVEQQAVLEVCEQYLSQLSPEKI